MTNIIIIKDLHIFARHGVMPQENITGDCFTVNLRLTADFSRAFSSDSLRDTISYADVCEIVNEEMRRTSKLIEHVSGRIIKAVFSRFPSVTSITLSIIKQNPPMGADCNGAGVEVTVTRDEFQTIN